MGPALGTSEEFRIAQPRHSSVKFRGGGLPTDDGFIVIGVGRFTRKKMLQEGKMRTVSRLTKPFEWSVSHDATGVVFRQEVVGEGGWGYRYVKRIIFAPDEPAFTIHHAMTNLSQQPLQRVHWCHNWFLIDGRPPGPDYRIEFAFEPAPGYGQSDRVETTGRTLRFVESLVDESPLYVQLAGFTDDPADNRIRVTHRGGGAGFEIQGHWPLSHYALYATGSEVCPEPVYALDVKTGLTANWATTYRAFVESAPNAGRTVRTPR